MKIHRVYNNGDRVTKDLPKDQAEAELSYSKQCRPGCALFRESECVQVGYLGIERCKRLSKELEEGK